MVTFCTRMFQDAEAASCMERESDRRNGKAQLENTAHLLAGKQIQRHSLLLCALGRAFVEFFTSSTKSAECATSTYTHPLHDFFLVLEHLRSSASLTFSAACW